MDGEHDRREKPSRLCDFLIIRNGRDDHRFNSRRIPNLGRIAYGETSLEDWRLILRRWRFIGLNPVLLLSGSQLAQVARNITTNELMNLHRYTYLRNSDGTFHNPFDRGVFKNFVAFFFVDPSRRLREFEEKADFRVSNNINVSTTDALV